MEREKQSKREINIEGGRPIERRERRREADRQIDRESETRTGRVADTTIEGDAVAPSRQARGSRDVLNAPLMHSHPHPVCDSQQIQHQVNVEHAMVCGSVVRPVNIRQCSLLYVVHRSLPFVLYPSFIVHRTLSFVLRPSTLVLCPLPFVFRLSPFVLHPSASDLRPPSFALCPSSLALHPSSFVFRTLSFDLRPLFFVLRPSPFAFRRSSLLGFVLMCQASREATGSGGHGAIRPHLHF